MIRALLIIFLLCPFVLWAQDSVFNLAGSNKAQVTVIAGKEYGRGSLHQWLWGKHYRKEWTTPVRVPIFLLDSAKDGLVPYQAGGGRQSKTLRLKNGKGKEYVLRSIDKTFGKALPEIYQRTFIEDIVNDQVSIAHPYSAIAIS